ncbi:hypothetical protein F4818DRAFT_454646 [Hypoxylon cercidicola]|nr:hypothetical protein F4818DRAFT_454646 [Hypoxylon cercidicola]
MSGSNPFSSLFNQQGLTARLAILQPAADHNAPIELSLSLTEAVLKDTSYECISYDRSSPEAIADVATVSVDGEAQPIPKALESALRTFRRKERPRTLWADLLVGRTPEERSAQATSLRHVLQNAERTLCWLGPDKGEPTAKAFETIREMARRYAEACAKVGISADLPVRRPNSFDFAHWRAIYDVFGASYWNSVQCISEIVLARAPLVVCGRSNIRWHAYIAASRAMPFYQAKFFQVPLLPHVVQGFDIANQIEVAERRRRLGESVELLPMIQTARDCRAADPRENVFAMMHIATPSARVGFHNAGPQPLPAIDYTKSAQQVFAETARYSILERQDLILERQDLILWFNDRPPCAKRLKGLPSWVPDFGAVPPTALVGLFNTTVGMRAWWDKIEPAPAPRPRRPRPPIFDAGSCRRLCLAEFRRLAAAPGSETVGRFWRALVLNAGAGADRSASAPLCDGPAAPAAHLESHFASLIAEETILHALGCATAAEMQTPANAARMRASPELMALVPRCGRAAPFAALLARHAAGRRFFRTAGGGFGMTAVEDVGAADSNLLGEEEDGARLRGLGRFMGDPISRGMLEGFQQYLQERDPAAARVAAQAMRGEIPGLEDGVGGRQRTDGGVREGDLVVACVGGFLPCVLRPWSQLQSGEEETVEGDKDSRPAERSSGEDGSTYEFVGECYLHGAMDGEDFQTTGPLGRKHFSVDVSKLVDITIEAYDHETIQSPTKITEQRKAAQNDIKKQNPGLM